MTNDNFQEVINDILAKIDEVKYDDKEKQILVYLVKALIIKFCDSKEAMENNFKILDEHTENRR